MRPIDFISALAQDSHGGVNIGNLLLAIEDAILDHKDLADWIDDSISLATTLKLSPRYAGWQAVWNKSARFQRRGAEAAFSPRAGERLIVFSTASKLRSSIKEQALLDHTIDAPPTGSAARLADYLLAKSSTERSNGKRHLSVFMPGRLVFYTKLEGQISLKRDELTIEKSEKEKQKIALFLLRFMGLPVAGGEVWLMTVFKPWSTAARLLRPTAFDGIDGRYFRQRPHEGVAGNWGRTADLNSCAPPALVADGASEAIGESLYAIDVEDCVVLPPMPMPSPDDGTLGPLYSQALLEYVNPGAIDWTESADQLAILL